MHKRREAEVRGHKLLLTIDEAAGALSVGRTMLYGLVMRGDIFSIKVGGLRRVPVKALDEYVARLCVREDF